MNMPFANTLSRVSRNPFRHAVSVVFLAIVVWFPGTAGAADYVLNFSSTLQTVNTPVKVTTANFTFEAWFKVTEFTGENDIVCQYIGSEPGRTVVYIKNTNPCIFLGGSSLTGTTTIELNTWTHIAVTRNGSTGTIYINGVLDKSGTLYTRTLSNSGITIGNKTNMANGFHGQIADVRAWNVARTQTDIFSSMNQRLSGSESGLIGYWPINDSAGASVNELVDDADGTNIGATWSFSNDFPLANPEAQYSWNAASGGNWSSTNNWYADMVPNGVAHSALFTNQPPAVLAVTNDLSPLLLGKMFLANTNGSIFSGNAITLTNTEIAATINASEGSHVFDLPLSFGSNGLILDSSTPSAVSLNNTISGSGTLTVNPAGSGGGTVTLDGTNNYTGSTAINCGTLFVSSLANGGVASSIGASSASGANLVLGPGTLRYTGGTATTDRGYTVTAPSRAAVIHVESGGNVTFGGQIQTTSGGQVKTGPGTVRYTYPGNNHFSSIHINDALLNIGANGDGPSQGFYGFGIAEGRVVLGAPGQVNTVNSRIVVGLYTTTAPGAETAGELEVIDGLLNLNNNTLGIGRSNGTTTTAPSGLKSKLIVSGGVITNAGFIALGDNNVLRIPGHNARSEMEMSGGTVYVDYLDIAEASGSSCNLNMSGGHLIASVRAGFAIASNTVATLNLSGNALFETLPNTSTTIPYGGAFATATLNLNGGVLQTRNVVRNYNSGSGTIYFNGGTLRPTIAGYTLQNMTAAYVTTNGAVIDTSLVDYTIAQDLLHDPALGGSDGGLVKLGTNTLTLSGSASTYTGSTIVSNGTLQLLADLPSASTLSVAPNGTVLSGGDACDTVTVAAVSLDTDAILAFAFTVDGASNGCLAVSSSPSLGNGQVTLYQQDTHLPFIQNGIYTIMTYSGTDPDTTGLTVVTPVYGKTYTFAASGGTLTVTIASDTANASVWNVNASGDWATASNWTLAPSGTAGSQVRFDDAISGPVSIATANETVGGFYFNNLNAYTLTGNGLTIDSDAASALINVESGAHTISAPLTLNDDTTLNLPGSTHLTLGSASGASVTLTAQGDGTLALTDVPSVQSLVLNVPELSIDNSLTLSSPVTLQRSVMIRPATDTTTTFDDVVSGANSLTKAGSSTLILSADNTFTGITRIDSGTLVANSLADGGQPSSIGASAAANANLILGPATFRYTGPSVTTDRGYTLSAGNSPVRAAILRIENDLTIGGRCTSLSGALLKTGPGTLRYTYTGGAQSLSSIEGNVDSLLNIGTNGDSPTTGFSAYTISNGKVIMGEAGQTNTINGRLTVGHYTTTAAGEETAGELQIDDGVLNCNTTVCIGRGNGTSITAPSGISSRLTINGGIINFNLLSAGYRGGANLSTHNARPVIDINAGTVTIALDTRIADSKGSIATLNVRGGTLRCLGQYHYAGLTLGGAQLDSGTGTLNLMGTGVVDIAHNVLLGAGSTTPGNGRLNLAGGVLIASNIVRGAGSGYVCFNGGTFFPRSPDRTLTDLTAAYVSTNGAVFDTTLADGYTVAQNLLHDPALGTADGGLSKLGTHTLSLTATGNTFNGPVYVNAGLLRARLSGTNDLSVATGATFDALGDRCTVGDLTGYGPCTNGIIAVTGILDAGTNGTPAGAQMTVANLSFVKGSTFVCDWTTNALGQVTNDFVSVTGTLTPEGAGFIDLGCTDENPITMPFNATIMSYGSLTSSFAGWKAINTGLPEQTHYATVITAAGGLVKLEVRYSGTVILIR
jgi:fibronectin-binding autotransporter adhesin